MEITFSDIIQSGEKNSLFCITVKDLKMSNQDILKSEVIQKVVHSVGQKSFAQNFHMKKPRVKCC